MMQDQLELFRQIPSCQEATEQLHHKWSRRKPLKRQNHEAMPGTLVQRKPCVRRKPRPDATLGTAESFAYRFTDECAKGERGGGGRSFRKKKSIQRFKSYSHSDTVDSIWQERERGRVCRRDVPK